MTPAISERLRPIRFRALIALAALIGAGGGALAAAYYYVLKGALFVVWDVLAVAVGPVWVVTALGGLLVGLSVRALGVPGEIAAVVDNIHLRRGRIDIRQTPSMTVTSLLSIAFGGSAGPEAPLVQIIGSLGSWAGDRLRLYGSHVRTLTFCGMAAALGAFFGAPLGGALFALEIPHRRGMEYYEALIPSLVAAFVSFEVFRALVPSHGVLFPFSEAPDVTLGTGLMGVGLGVLGAGLGVAFIALFRTMGRALHRFEGRPVLLATAGGLALGLLATAYSADVPATVLFWGEFETRDLVLAQRAGAGRDLDASPAGAREGRRHRAHAPHRLPGRVHLPALLHRRRRRPRALPRQRRRRAPVRRRALPDGGAQRGRHADPHQHDGDPDDALGHVDGAGDRGRQPGQLPPHHTGLAHPHPAVAALAPVVVRGQHGRRGAPQNHPCRPMISVLDADRLLRTHVRVSEAVAVPLAEVGGRVLREPVVADRDVPPFDRVAMDGIAVASAGLSGGVQSFRVASTQAAGEPPHALPEADACVEIMTGAALPDGCDAVVRYEDLVLADGQAALREGVVVTPGQNIHGRGTDRRAGEPVLAPGVRLGPPRVAALAALGRAQVRVSAVPRVAVVTTGDEVVAVDVPVLPHQIRQSNGPAIGAALALRGYGDLDSAHVPDAEGPPPPEAGEAASTG